MELDLLRAKIKNGDTHCDYDRVVEVAKQAFSYNTNKGLDERLRSYKTRETAEAFEQRKRLTRHTIKSVVSSLKKPFYKVSRNDKVKEVIEVNDESKRKAVDGMMSSFYGRQGQGGGLDKFMRTRFVDLTWNDPNSWVVVEWGSFTAGTLPEPYPFEVTAAEARDFEFIRGQLQWLYVAKAISFNVKTDTKYKRPKTKNGMRYTLYGRNVTVVMRECDKAWLELNPTEMPANGKLIKFEEKYYIQQEFAHKAGIVTAFRVGYKTDDETKGRTFVAPFDDAEPYLEKMIQSNSEFDITISGHVFPQKWQYVNTCTGPTPEQRCNRGKLADGNDCPSCGGTGMLTHSSAQDAIYLPFPNIFEGTDDSSIIDLKKLMHYAGPPIDTVTFQQNYIDALEVKTHQAMYNSTVFVKVDNPKIAQTATEKDQDMDSAYDTLLPFAEQYSQMWVDLTSVMVILCGLKLDKVKIRHTFPKDFKLRTMTQQLNHLKTLNEAQAPSFLKDSVNRDLYETIVGGDESDLLKYDVKQRFFPFSGKSETEILYLMASQYVSQFNKVLYANFELVFREIEKDNPGFFILTFKKQWDIVGEKVNAIIADIGAGSADTFQVGDFANDTPGGSKTGEQDAQQNQQGNAAA